MLDRFLVVDRLQDLGQFSISPDHCSRGLIAIVRDFQRRRQDQELRIEPPVSDQRRHHDAGGDGRFRVLLADQEEELGDMTGHLRMLISAEDRPHEIENERLACLPEGRHTGHVHDTQRLEHGKRSVCLVGKQRLKRHQRLPLDDPGLPVRASRRPVQHQFNRSGGDGGAKSPVTPAATSSAISFLPFFTSAGGRV